MEQENTVEKVPSKKYLKKLCTRKLRISLKYRPKVWRLILSLKRRIKEKNNVIKQTKIKLQKLLITKCEVACQTEHATINAEETKQPAVATDSTEENNGWAENGSSEKSLADQVKEAAQSALDQTGMVYVESAGMYYDYKTGYYYNSELGLYYHTNTSCYYYYSDEKKEFVFHSYPDTSKMTAASLALQKHVKKKAKKQKQEQEDGSQSPKKKKIRTVKKVQKPIDGEDTDINPSANKNEKDYDIDDEIHIPKEKVPEDLEDGECSDTQSDCSVDTPAEDSSTASEDDSVAAHHPPCMRLVVRETTLPRLRVGSLFVVTKEGGTVGREGAHHAVLLPENNVSRNHLEISYDATRRAYTARDLGSKNGTVLNGRRMSASQVASEHMEIPHGSVLVLGVTKLLCHVHPGADTCGHCEPGLIMEADNKAKKTAYTRTCSVQKQHQLELARLKNKYAPTPLAIEDGAYNDRAKARRDTVGSSHAAEKTQQSDLDTAIAADNKGFQMLQKMGWAGAGLGREGQGATEPVPLVTNECKAGLGAAGSAAPVAVGAVGSVPLKLRHKALRPPARLFRDPLEEDD